MKWADEIIEGVLQDRYGPKAGLDSQIHMNLGSQRALVLATVEACARECEAEIVKPDHADDFIDWTNGIGQVMAEQCAARLRALLKESPEDP